MIAQIVSSFGKRNKRQLVEQARTEEGRLRDWVMRDWVIGN